MVAPKEWKGDFYIPEAVRKWPHQLPWTEPMLTDNALDTANLKDNGFNHLDIPASRADIEDVARPKVFPPKFYDDNPAIEDALTAAQKEKKWLELVSQKLALARDFIHKERELGLDIQRNMSKDPTSTLLAAGPVRFEVSTQEMIRDIVDITIDMNALRDRAEEPEVYAKLQAMAADYLLAWRYVRGVVMVFIPGKGEVDRRDKLERMMVSKLGKMIEEEGVDSEELGEE